MIPELASVIAPSSLALVPDRLKVTGVLLDKLIAAVLAVAVTAPV